MMNKSDIEFIKDSHNDIRKMREDDVKFNIRNKVGEHPVTEEPIYEKTDLIIPAVVTKVTTSTNDTGNSKVMDEGIKVVVGDVILDVNLELFPEELPLDSVDVFKYDDVNYKVISYGKLGLGEDNRVELLGRRVF